MSTATITVYLKDDKGGDVSRTVVADVGGNLTHPGILEGELDKLFAKASRAVTAAVRS